MKDQDEKDILKDFENGKFKKTKNSRKETKLAQRAAVNYLNKSARINIRLSIPDLKLLKRKAVEEAMPYQTLIASVLHKYVLGRLKVS
ncbi:MAG: antitoxin [Deltaproteobacteria bacterium]|nr:antitoxin [Deltaproteobacteria bacterium]